MTGARLDEAQRQLEMASQAAEDTYNMGKDAARKHEHWRTASQIMILLLSGSASVVVIGATTKLGVVPSSLAVVVSFLLSTGLLICSARSTSATTSKLSNFRESAAWDAWTGDMRLYIARLVNGDIPVNKGDDPEWRKLQRRRERILQYRWSDIEMEHRDERTTIEARAKELMTKAALEREK